MSAKRAIRFSLAAATCFVLTAGAASAHADLADMEEPGMVRQEANSLASGNAGLIEQTASPQVTGFTQISQSGTTRQRRRTAKPRRVRNGSNTMIRSLRTGRINRFACGAGNTQDCSQQSQMDAKREHDYVGNYNFKVELE